MEIDSIFSPDEIPGGYDREPTYSGMIRDRDVMVPMRDGTHICVDIYRPDTQEKLPTLLAFAIYNKDLQGPGVAEVLPSQPSWAPQWAGLLEAGDTHFLVSRGYIHVIGSPRGIGKSEGGGSREFDSYDLIEWIAKQPWSDGQVGTIGISGFGAEQLHVARQQPPSLKAIFPFDPRGAFGTLGSFREEYPGGVLHLFRYLIGHFSAFHGTQGQLGELPPERDALWKAAMENSDYGIYPNVRNVVAQKGQHMPAFFNLLLEPYANPDVEAKAKEELSRIKVPTYTGSGWYAYTYKTHLNGAQNYFEHIDAPKRLAFHGPQHLERPFHTLHSEILRWYDYWLKGIDTGLNDEPPVKYWLMGANTWKTAQSWPPENVEWSKLYLNSWERLRPRPFSPSSVDQFREPDVFVQMPITQTKQVQKLRYLTDPLPQAMTIAGPAELVIYAEIDREDTNWFVTLKDVGPDVSVQSAREGERDRPSDIPERELTRGWLKASHRAIDEDKSRPGRPWHPLSREAQKKVEPGKIEEYRIEILATANRFEKGHRICIEIAAMDVPTGIGGATNAEYIPYHICSSETVVHRVYHGPDYPSHLLLPIVPCSTERNVLGRA